jgi:PhnB protein
MTLRVYLDDVDATFNRALAAGAIEDSPVEDQFWGDRMGSLTDPFGYRRMLSQHLEEAPREEIEKRIQEKLL